MALFQGSLCTASRQLPLFATLDGSALTVLSTKSPYTPVFNATLSPLQPVSSNGISPFSLSKVPLARQISFHNTSHPTLPSSARLLVHCSDGSILVYDALTPSYHATVTAAAGPGATAGLSYIGFVSPDEILVIPQFVPRLTIWDLRTGKGTEVRDPKPLVNGRATTTDGIAIRPRSGHIALLARPGTRDLVTILAPPAVGQSFSSSSHPLGPGGTRKASGRVTSTGVGTGDELRVVEASFELETTDARGLRWSDSGDLLAVWDTPAQGPALWIYTADGQLLRRWNGERESKRTQNGTGAEMDDNDVLVELGVERVQWCGDKICIGMGDGRILMLGGKTLSLIATLHHPSVITSLQPSSKIYQEQLTAGGASRSSFTVAPLPSSPPPPASNPSSFSSSSSTGVFGVSHLSHSPNPIFDDDGRSSFLIASVSASTPTAVWITSIPDDRNRLLTTSNSSRTSSPRTVAVLVLHRPVSKLSWQPQDENGSSTTAAPRRLLVTCIGSQADAPAYVWTSSAPSRRRTSSLRGDCHDEPDLPSESSAAVSADAPMPTVIYPPQMQEPKAGSQQQPPPAPRSHSWRWLLSKHASLAFSCPPAGCAIVPLAGPSAIDGNGDSDGDGDGETGVAAGIDLLSPPTVPIRGVGPEDAFDHPLDFEDDGEMTTSGVDDTFGFLKEVGGRVARRDVRTRI